MANITNSGGTNIADVDANGRLKVQPPTDGTNAGAMFLVGKSDLSSPSNTGSITGSSQGLLGMANVVLDYDKNIASTSLLNNDLITLSSGMTQSIATNILTLNSGSSVILGSYIGYRSPRFFKLEKGTDRIFGFRLKLDQAPVTNSMLEMGAFLSAGVSAPTGGVFFRFGVDGTLKGVAITQSGLENVTSNIPMSTPTDFHEYVIVVGRSTVTFFIDEIPVASLGIPTDAANIVTGESYPIAIRLLNVGVTGTAQKAYVTRLVSATMGGAAGADIRYLQALRGDFGIQQVIGTTVGVGGSTANWTNSTVPATATLSNTLAGYSTLGGNFLFVALAGAESDYALFGYQVFYGSLVNMGRSLVVRGVTIDAYVAVAGGTPTVATVLHWGFAVGSMAVSLATTETAGSKGPRRGFLGIQSVPVAAVAGTELRRIAQTFEQPVAVHPGEYFHIILRIPLGAAATYPTIRGGVFIDASWE